MLWGAGQSKGVYLKTRTAVEVETFRKPQRDATVLNARGDAATLSPTPQSHHFFTSSNSTPVP